MKTCDKSIFRKFAVVVLVLSIPIVLSANNAMAISPSPQHRSLALHMNNAVIQSLKDYASALGEKYIEGEHSQKNITVQDVINANESRTIKNDEAYTNAQKHASDAQLLFVELIPVVNASSPHHIVEVQSGLIMFKNLIDKKAPYNLAEDVVQSPILNHLNEIIQMNTTAAE
jgi:hypothetical protein